jgi:flagellar biosynthesis protein FliP
MGVNRRWMLPALLALAAVPVYAAGAAPFQVNLGGGGQAGYLRLVVLFASVSLAPALLAVLTSFLRIIVVLYFLRAGLGSQQLLPNQVLMGLAILLTVFTMARPLQDVNQTALQPLLAGKIDAAAAGRAAEPVMRQYLTAHVRPADLALMTQYESQPPNAAASLPAKPAFTSLAAAYVLSELRAAFVIGFVIFLPFMVIDLVVAGTLASLGLVAMPQAMLALPFKILLFVMVDGWRLLADALLASLR